MIISDKVYCGVYLFSGTILAKHFVIIIIKIYDLIKSEFVKYFIVHPGKLMVQFLKYI